MFPLSRHVNKKNKSIITQEQARGLFSNVEVILDLNRIFLADLEVQIPLPPKNWSFLPCCKMFSADTNYCSNHKNADDLCIQLKASNSSFNTLLEETVQNPESRLLDLQAFLIKPVQRACKYPLLLRELLKHTLETHPDYQNLKEAYEAMQASCLKLNAATLPIIQTPRAK